MREINSTVRVLRIICGANIPKAGESVCEVPYTGVVFAVSGETSSSSRPMTQEEIDNATKKMENLPNDGNNKNEGGDSDSDQENNEKNENNQGGETPPNK